MVNHDGDILLEDDPPNMIGGPQAHLQSAMNDQVHGPQNPESRLMSPKDLRNNTESTAASFTQTHSSPNRARRKLKCSKCSKLVRSCRGEPGESCNACSRNKTWCSFLDPRPFRCKRCNRDYITEAALRGHITSKHTRENSYSVNPDLLKAPQTTNSINHVLESPGGGISRLSDNAGSQRRGSPGPFRPSMQVPESPQQPPMRNLRPGPIQGEKLNPSGFSHGKTPRGASLQYPDQRLLLEEVLTLSRYQGLNFEVFETDPKRNLNENYVQGTLDAIRDEIEQYGEFIRGKDENTPVDLRERLRFLDEVTPLIHLREIDEETHEIFGLPSSRLVMLLRSMFAVQGDTRLEEEFENLSPDVRFLKLPHLVCGVLGYLLLQLFTKKDPIREAELRAMESTHGLMQAANTIQHSRLIANESSTLQAKLENRARKLARSFYDILRPLTHRQQDTPHNGSEEQHIERLEKIILPSLRLAAELEARKGTFSFFWPRSGEDFDPSLHIDEADNSTLESMNKGPRRNQLVAFVLMPGVVRKMDNKELVDAKATVILIQPDVNDCF